ncbi:hypothetical protein [Herbidospora mongoliensis]|uniref:hypothetical protein n=1 Tax=Herbidospora mongoliensis TaxID=688067 RepID=UPI00082EF99B|nr:hypothetical protein [Herbidospora mongoliensis]
MRDDDRAYVFAIVHHGVTLSADDTLVDAGRLVDNVGGQGMTFNRPLSPGVDVFGYQGPTLEHATGPRFPVDLTHLPSDRPVGVDSAWTGEGALGSSWLADHAGGLGYLNGVTIGVADTDGDGVTDTAVSPYFDGDAWSVFKAVSSYWSGRIV